MKHKTKPKVYIVYSVIKVVDNYEVIMANFEVGLHKYPMGACLASITKMRAKYPDDVLFMYEIKIRNGQILWRRNLTKSLGW